MYIWILRTPTKVPKTNYFCIMIKLKQKYKTPSEYAEFLGLEYARTTSNKHKKDNGQFFTPKQIADFMGDLASPQSDKISILDPGCGTGIVKCPLLLGQFF